MFKPTKKQHVVNKAYADQNGGSGGGTIMAIISDNNTVETLDKTVDEIIQMLSNGSSPFVVAFDDTPGAIFPFSNLGYIEDIKFSPLNARFEVDVRQWDGVIRYTASLRSDYPSREFSGNEETIE